MRPTQSEISYYGEKAEVYRPDKGYNVYTLREDSGYVKMTSYDVFDGISVVYNDVHLTYCETDIVPPRDILQINHCRRGRIEFSFTKNDYLYVSEGDVIINLRQNEEKFSYFPLGSYYGITVIIDLNKAGKEVERFIGNIDLNELKEKLCGDDSFTLIRGERRFEHIFSELYDVPEKLRDGYFRVKVMELILFLSGIERKTKEYKQVYFQKKQVEKIKEIKKYITDNVSEHITLGELSDRFDISLTTLKTCFKGVYGVSVYSFAKEYKMQAAAEMLIKTDKSILEIAQSVGYSNGGKFSRAFEERFGVLPREYRKNY